MRRRLIATAATTALVAGSAFLAPLANAADPGLSTYTFKDQGVSCEYVKGAKVTESAQADAKVVMATSTDPVASTLCLTTKAPVSLDDAQANVKKVWKDMGSASVVKRTEHTLVFKFDSNVANQKIVGYAAVYTDAKMTAEMVWSYTDAKLDGTREKAINDFLAQFDGKAPDKGDMGDHHGDKGDHHGDSKDHGRGVPAKTGDN